MITQVITRAWIRWSHRWYSIFCVYYQWERYGTSVANLINICHCIMVQKNWNYRRDWDIGSCESLVIWFQNLLTILAWFLQKCIWKQLQFQSHLNNVEKNGTFSLFETSVNGNMTFAYIMTFHCTRVYLRGSLGCIEAFQVCLKSHTYLSRFNFDLSDKTWISSIIAVGFSTWKRARLPFWPFLFVCFEWGLGLVYRVYV